MSPQPHMTPWTIISFELISYNFGNTNDSTIYVCGEGKFHPTTGHEASEGSRGIALLFL